MDIGNYCEKYKQFFNQPQAGSVVSQSEKLAGTINDITNSVNSKYSVMQMEQINERANSFKSTLAKAIEENYAPLLSPFVLELKEIGKRSSSLAKTLAVRYFSHLVKADDIFDKYLVALNFLKEMSGISKGLFADECAECCVKFINKYDDIDAEPIADEFYSCAQSVAPDNAWVRFRKFRLGLGCHKNGDFISLDDDNYKEKGEGAKIYKIADSMLRELFNQQAATYGRRLEKDAADKKAAEEAYKEQKRQEEEKRKKDAADAVRRKEARKRNLIGGISIGLGAVFIALAVILGIKPIIESIINSAQIFVGESDESTVEAVAESAFNLPVFFMQEMPLLLASIICLYTGVSVLKRTKFRAAIAYGVTVSAIVFMSLFLIFIIFVWSNPDLFEVFVKGSYYSKDHTEIVPPVWATVLAFIGGLIVLGQLIMGLVAEHKDGLFTPYWLLDTNPVIWVEIILTVISSIFFFACGFAFEALDNSYVMGYFITACVMFGLGLFSFWLLVGNNDNLHDSYFYVHVVFNCVKAGLFILCSLSAIAI